MRQPLVAKQQISLVILDWIQQSGSQKAHNLAQRFVSEKIISRNPTLRSHIVELQNAVSDVVNALATTGLLSRDGNATCGTEYALTERGKLVLETEIEDAAPGMLIDQFVESRIGART